ncbi:hypothetical protein LTR36_008814 [Oleoguttula mirabilis]|uniref:Chromo domain-containing protein n=1 Tax=Oleoguttula mirabilis TaxID=1507867 RepID=A0AAV9J765_9PEZI|nr:hypothetical protein LTR36_008814 [Oleoguttula mirabilis]
MPRGRKVLLEVIIGEQTGEDGRVEYLAKWARFPIDGATWESKENSEEGAQEALATWEREKEDLKQPSDTSSSEGDGDDIADVLAPESHAASQADFVDTDLSAVSEAEPGLGNQGNAVPPAEEDLIPLQDNGITTISRAAQRCASPARANVDARQSHHHHTYNDTQSERSESDDSDIHLPAGHIVSSEPKTPRAITGALEFGIFRMACESHPTTGREAKPQWFPQKIVPPSLIAAWEERKAEVFHADDSGKRVLAEKYDIVCSGARIYIMPKLRCADVEGADRMSDSAAGLEEAEENEDVRGHCGGAVARKS